MVGSPCCPSDSQESSPIPQFKTINSSALSFLYSPTLTSIHDHWKTIALTRWTFVGKVMSLLFNMLSKLVITFLLRSKHLLISWLQSPSAVILEPTKIKSVTVSTVSPSICHSYPFKDPCYWSAAVSNLLRPRGLQHTGFPVCHYFPDFAQTHIH